jgi:hypothetical protein
MADDASSSDSSQAPHPPLVELRCQCGKIRRGSASRSAGGGEEPARVHSQDPARPLVPLVDAARMPTPRLMLQRMCRGSLSSRGTRRGGACHRRSRISGIGIRRRPGGTACRSLAAGFLLHLPTSAPSTFGWSRQLLPQCRHSSEEAEEEEVRLGSCSGRPEILGGQNL